MKRFFALCLGFLLMATPLMANPDPVETTQIVKQTSSSQFIMAEQTIHIVTITQNQVCVEQQIVDESGAIQFDTDGNAKTRANFAPRSEVKIEALGLNPNDDTGVIKITALKHHIALEITKDTLMASPSFSTPVHSITIDRTLYERIKDIRDGLMA